MVGGAGGSQRVDVRCPLSWTLGKRATNGDTTSYLVILQFDFYRIVTVL